MKSQLLNRLAIALIVLLILLFFMIGFQVRQTELAVLTRFGQPVRVIDHPGLYLKWPWPIETVNRFDGRLNFFDIRISEALTRDKRNVIVPVFVVWKIRNALRFLEAMGGNENAQNKLDSLVSSAKNTILANYDFNQLVSSNPDKVKLAEIEKKIAEATAPQARETFGITIEQVGIKRLTLPAVNTQYVLERMRAERAQFAEQYRAEGRRQADEINAQTAAEQTVILAKARQKAEETRGKGEAEAAHIYAQAHAQAPEFYRFLRELEAFKKVVNGGTTLVLDSKTPPFELLNGPPNLSVTPATKAAGTR
jgi:membrane protease subunit HflC